MTQGPQEANSPPLPSGRSAGEESSDVPDVHLNKDASPLCRAERWEGRGDIHEILQGSLGPTGPLRQVTPATHRLLQPLVSLATLARPKPPAQRVRLPQWGLQQKARGISTAWQQLPHLQSSNQCCWGWLSSLPLPEAIGAKLCLACLSKEVENARGWGVEACCG